MNKNIIEKLEKQLEKERKKQVFVNALSPGTFFSEQDRFEVEDKNLVKVLKEIKKITQRHGAKPYGFRFEDGNGKVLSGIYYITGKLLKYDDIPDDLPGFLKSNMRSNKRPICIENTNSYRFTCQFEPQDFIIDWDGKILIKGDNSELMKYREIKNKDFEDYFKKIRAEFEEKYS